jgi:hypothetical protein
MLWKLRVMLSVIALLVVVQFPAVAQVVCAPATDMLAAAEKEYGEKGLFAGKMQDGRPVYLMLNPETGSWTVFVDRGDGQLCAAVVGETGGPFRAPPPGKPS